MEVKYMLIDFITKNFASFKNETELSFQTGARLYKYKETNTFPGKDVSVLKNLLLFGPNGAGKSELLQGILTMAHLIRIGGTKSITDKLVYNPFLFNPNSAKDLTYFAVTLKYQKQIYEYSFSYDADHIESEKLVLILSNSEKTYFERKGQDFLVLPDKLKGLTDNLRKNALFLYLAQQNNDLHASGVFTWFSEDLVFLGSNVMIPEKMLELLSNEKLKQEMIDFLSFADFNIVDLNLRRVAIDDPILRKISTQLDAPLPTDRLEIYTSHKVYDDQGNVLRTEELPLSSESQGTQRIFYIVLAMIFSQVNGNHKTIVIDEFDESLHHELADSLVKLFNTKENSNQFLLATHDLELLDNEIRTDQIYLIEKDFKGVSTLKSIFDFSDSRNLGRLNVSFLHRYLKGQFGAMPIIDLDGLKETLKSIHEEVKKSNNEKKA